MRQIQQDLLSTLMRLHPAPQTVLDVGCGNGAFTRIMASALPHSHISTVDPKLSERTMNTRNIAYFQSGVEALPFKPNSFDVVVACLSFHHWSSKQGGLQEAFRVLNPTGLLLLGDPFFEGIMRNRFMAWLLQKTDSGKFTSFEEIEPYFEDAGFESMLALPVSSSFGTMFIVSDKSPCETQCGATKQTLGRIKEELFLEKSPMQAHRTEQGDFPSTGTSRASGKSSLSHKSPCTAQGLSK